MGQQDNASWNVGHTIDGRVVMEFAVDEGGVMPVLLDPSEAMSMGDALCRQAGYAVKHAQGGQCDDD
jgi:hypothetical protein